MLAAQNALCAVPLPPPARLCTAVVQAGCRRSCCLRAWTVRGAAGQSLGGCLACQVRQVQLQVPAAASSQQQVRLGSLRRCSLLLPILQLLLVLPLLLLLLLQQLLPSYMLMRQASNLLPTLRTVQQTRAHAPAADPPLAAAAPQAPPAQTQPAARSLHLRLLLAQPLLLPPLQLPPPSRPSCQWCRRCLLLLLPPGLYPCRHWSLFAWVLLCREARRFRGL